MTSLQWTYLAIRPSANLPICLPPICRPARCLPAHCLSDLGEDVRPFRNHRDTRARRE
jgi:hypothetical protein